LGKVRIVTDSSAHFLNPEVIERYQIEIIPHTIQLANHSFREGADLDTGQFFDLASSCERPAVLTPPSVDDFTEVFHRLNQQTDQILPLLMSRQMSKAWDNALLASKTLLGRCEIVPVDSMTTSVGLAILVEQAAQAAEAGESLEEVVRIVRAKLSHVYAAFFVDSLTSLRHNGLLSEAQSVLGTMLNIKPFLTIEEGELIPMEKVRTHAEAIDKLIEFVSEFTALEQLVILHSAPVPREHTSQLHDRLAIEFPGHEFPIVRYRPGLASMIGLDGIGVVVYEGLDAGEDL